MGSTPSIPQARPSQSFSDLLGQSQGLYNQAASGFQAPAALNDYVNQMMQQGYNKDYLSGTAGSSVEAANQAQGVTSAYDQYQQQYLQDLFGLGKGQAQQDYRYNMANVPINQQNQMAQYGSQMMPWEMAGSAISTLPFFL